MSSAWSDARPSAPGWYWWRLRELPELAEIVRVKHCGLDTLYFEPVGRPAQAVHDCPGEFAGPIAEPDEPTQPPSSGELTDEQSHDPHDDEVA